MLRGFLTGAFIPFISAGSPVDNVYKDASGLPRHPFLFGLLTPSSLYLVPFVDVLALKQGNIDDGVNATTADRIARDLRIALVHETDSLEARATEEGFLEALSRRPTMHVVVNEGVSWKAGRASTADSVTAFNFDCYKGATRSGQACAGTSPGWAKVDAVLDAIAAKNAAYRAETDADGAGCGDACAEVDVVVGIVQQAFCEAFVLKLRERDYFPKALALTGCDLDRLRVALAAEAAAGTKRFPKTQGAADAAFIYTVSQWDKVRLRIRQ